MKEPKDKDVKENIKCIIMYKLSSSSLIWRKKKIISKSKRNKHLEHLKGNARLNRCSIVSAMLQLMIMTPKIKQTHLSADLVVSVSLELPIRDVVVVVVAAVAVEDNGVEPMLDMGRREAKRSCNWN